MRNSLLVILLFGIALSLSGEEWVDPDKDGNGVLDYEEFGRDYWNNLSEDDKYTLVCGYHFGLYWGAMVMSKLYPETRWAVPWVAPGGNQTRYMINKVDQHYADPDSEDLSLMFLLWPGQLPNKELEEYGNEQNTY